MFKKISLIGLCLIGMTNLLSAEEIKLKGSDYVLNYEKLSVGLNTIKLTGTKVNKETEAKVKVFMPEMPGMPYMEYKDYFKLNDKGELESKINLSMGGTWQGIIYIKDKENTIKLRTSLNI